MCHEYKCQLNNHVKFTDVSQKANKKIILISSTGVSKSIVFVNFELRLKKCDERCHMFEIN